MRHNKLFWIPLFSVFCLMATHFSVNADLVQVRYDPIDITTQFNSMNVNSENEGLGWYFTRTIPSELRPRSNLATSGNNDPDNQINVNAYIGSDLGGTSSGKSFLTTFYCRVPFKELDTGYAYMPIEVRSPSEVYSFFYYEQTKILSIFPVVVYETIYTPHYLSLGIACLYAQFIAGNDMVDNPNVNDLHSALKFLMGDEQSGIASWADQNPYLRYLLGITLPHGIENTSAYWEGAYNLMEDNELIGDYYIFIMSVKDLDGFTLQGNKMLYAHDKYYYETYDDPESTPEPATLLLWTLGGLGLGGTSWLRRRNKKRLVLA